MSEQAACVVALAARTPVGLTAYSSAAAVRAGISRIGEHPTMVDKAGDPFRVAMDRTLDVTGRVERMFGLAASALDELLEQLPCAEHEPLTILLGLPELGAQFSAREATLLRARWTQHLRMRCRAEIESFAEGNAAGVLALERALARIAAQPDRCCVVGGVDSFIDADVLEALDDTASIASSSNRWGFPPGEGAAMIAICSPSFAQRHRLRVLAAIAAVARSVEPNRAHTDTVCVGVGLADAMRNAALGAGAPITMQYCDINGERYREHEFSYAALRVPAHAFANAIEYVAPADCWGHTGAATAPLLLSLPIVFHDRGASPGARPMVWCGSDNGQRGAVVLRFAGRHA
jgi:3-oxoacyl-[acyl-carrier-protein] synthase I